MAAPDQPRFTLAQRLLLAFVPRVVWALLSLWGRTWRFEVIVEEGATPVLYGEQPGPQVVCFWHQCILPGDIYFRRSRTVLLISQSFDGELIARIAQLFGYGVARGSSSRGSREALMGLKQAIEAGRSAIFTADGPRGPVFQSKMGPVKLAHMTGVPIRVFHVQPERFWALSSWDSFMLPKPFTRVVVSWAKDLSVAADLPPEEFESKRQELDAALERARLRALDHFKKATG
jgi:lysophospholipid acyltransferase (LPLAT)-like uncharacterized protein